MPLISSAQAKDGGGGGGSGSGGGGRSGSGGRNFESASERSSQSSGRERADSSEDNQSRGEGSGKGDGRSERDEGKSKRGSGGGDGRRADNEILAVNLSPAGVEQARKLGFDVREPSPMSQLRGSLTRLIPPRDMAASQARDLLRQSEPGEQFAINQRYKIYQPARKEMAADAENTAAAQRGGCARDKCFGSQIIGWRQEIQSCAQGLRIGVIDTAVDMSHPAFSHAKINVGRFLPEGAKDAPAWHGTGVLSVLAGDPDSGTPGLIPRSNFFFASVFFQDKEGEVETDTLNVLSALDWMGAFKVNIVNMSFSGPKDELVEAAIASMSQQGVLFVAAVGNDGPAAQPSYPASYPSVVAVTAVAKDMRNYPYANRGNRVDVAAPGVDIWSAVPNAREGYHTGTSFATPYVTAILAAAQNSQGRAQKKEELLDRLLMLDLGPAGRDPIYGRGLALAPATCGERVETVASTGSTTPITQASTPLRRAAESLPAAISGILSRISGGP